MTDSDPRWTQAASEELHHTVCAVNTIQGEATVWCTSVMYIMSLKERQTGKIITLMSPISDMPTAY